MLRKSFMRSLYVIPAMAAVILFATYLWYPNYLITPPRLSGFAEQIEETVAVLMIVFYSFLLPNRFEIELGLVNGYSTLRLAVSKAFPVFVYSFLTSFAAVAAYRYTPYDLKNYKSFLPIYVPDDFRIYVFISVFTVLLFFSSVYFFFRVLTRNCFIPVIIDLAAFSSLSAISEGIRKGTSDLRLSLVDPFITKYFVGNTVPNALSERIEGMSALKNAWTVNRLVFLFLSLVLLAATLFLLRREKLHKGPGE